MTILDRDPSEPPEQREPACPCGYPGEPGFCPGPLNCPRVPFIQTSLGDIDEPS